MPDIQSIKSKIAEVAQAHNLVLVVLYGSQARGKATEASDVDIAVLGEKPIAFDELVALNNDFADVFEVKELDVKSLHHSDPLFRYQVTRDGVLLFGDPRDFYSFKAYAFRDYHDSSDLFRLKEIMIRKRLHHLQNA